MEKSAGKQILDGQYSTVHVVAKLSSVLFYRLQTGLKSCKYLLNTIIVTYNRPSEQHKTKSM